MIPSRASSATASRARSSPIAQNASIPRLTAGQATGETRPQLSPAITESCGPGTSAGSPASIEASAHAALTGSTPTIRAPAKRRTIAAANEPTPIWTATTSGWTSISAPIVEYPSTTQAGTVS